MSIVRIGLAETKHFADGYEAIFGKKKTVEEKRETPVAKTGTGKKKKKPRKK